MTLQYPDDPLRRESHEMRASQWAALEELATRLGCVNERGPKAGQPSWRALLYRMAEAMVPPTPKPVKELPPPKPKPVKKTPPPKPKSAKKAAPPTPKPVKVPPPPPSPSPLDTAICELFGIEPIPLWNKEMIREAKARQKAAH